MIDNVCPCIKRHTPSRDEFMVQTSEVSPSCNENYRSVGHAADRFVDVIDRRFSCLPLLNRDCGSLLKFGGHLQNLSRNSLAAFRYQLH